MALFKEEGIVYAETAVNFSEGFYLDLGLTEGVIVEFLLGVKRMLGSEKKEKKRVRAFNREYSAEI